jgi:hypothetical protein
MIGQLVKSMLPERAHNESEKIRNLFIDAKDEPMKILITQHAVDRFQERFPELIHINIQHALDKSVPYGATTKDTLNLLNTEHNIVFVVQKPELVLMTILTLDLYIANLQSTFWRTTAIPFKTSKTDIQQLALNYKHGSPPNKANMMHRHSLTEAQYEQFIEEHKRITKPVEPPDLKALAIECAKTNTNLNRSPEHQASLNLTNKQYADFYKEYENYLKTVIIKQFAIEYAIEQNMRTIHWSRENDKLMAARYGISVRKMVDFWGEYYYYVNGPQCSQLTTQTQLG